MKTPKLTKAQIKRMAILESRGYDHGYTLASGNPVLVLREKGIWVEVDRKGNFKPAAK